MAKRRYLKGLTVSQRLAAYSVKDPVTGCRKWTAGVNSAGYGLINVGGKSKLAHRVAFELVHGSVRAGYGVLHTCDTPSCINTDHLYEGTQDDNVQDMVAAGRQRYALAKDRTDSKLSDDDVRAIRKDARLNVDIAPEYGVTAYFIGQIKSRKRRAYVED